jgi:hypothetical protein
MAQHFLPLNVADAATPASRQDGSQKVALARE